MTSVLKNLLLRWVCSPCGSRSDFSETDRSDCADSYPHCERTINTLGHQISAAVLSSDGTRLYTGFLNGSIAVWDSTSLRKLKEFPAHYDSVQRLVFHHSGHLFSNCFDESIQVWDTDHDCRLIHTFVVPGAGVRSISVNHRGDRLVCGTACHFVCLFCIPTAECLRSWNGHSARVPRVSFVGGRIVSGSEDGSLKVWDAGCETEKLTVAEPGSNQGVCDLAVNCDCSLLACHLGDGVSVFSWPSMNIARHFQLKHGANVAFHPAIPDILAADHSRGQIDLYNVSSGECIRSFQAHKDLITGLMFRPDGTDLISVSYDQRACFWDCSGLA